MIVMELIMQFLYRIREIAHSWLSCIICLAVHQVALSPQNMLPWRISAKQEQMLGVLIP